MAASIVTKATTLEQQAFETVNALRGAIADYQAANPEEEELELSVVPELDTINGLAIYTVTIPITQSNDPDGGISFDATELLP